MYLLKLEFSYYSPWLDKLDSSVPLFLFFLGHPVERTVPQKWRREKKLIVSYVAELL